MAKYTVVWIIDVEADDEISATNQALDIMKQADDPEYDATSFAVLPVQEIALDGAVWVDLGADDPVWIPSADEARELREIVMSSKGRLNNG